MANWSVAGAPAHGSVTAAYSVTINGDTLAPSGISYTPAAGYSGSDSFKIMVADCGFLSDIATVYVTINPLPATGIITGTDSVCLGGAPVTLTNAVTGGAWSSSNARAAVVGGVVTGVSAGTAVISYTVVSPVGCSASAVFPMKVAVCPNGIFPDFYSEVEPRLIISPNPNEGVFTINVLSGADEEARVVVTNTIGRKIKELGAPTNRATNIKLDVPAGIYFMSVVTAHGRYMEKIVVKR